MRGRPVLECLRDGPKTTAEIAAVIGWSRSAISSGVCHLNGAGYVIRNLTVGRYKPALYELVYDVERPALRLCTWPGCTTILSDYNPSALCYLHHHVAAQRLVKVLDAYFGEVSHEQRTPAAVAL